MEIYGVCHLFTRKFDCGDAGPPPAIGDAFSAYAEGATLISPEQLRRFLMEFQGEAGASAADAEALVRRFRSSHDRSSEAIAKQGLTVDEFYLFLLSEDNKPPIRCQIHHDMRAPISDYYIYTGHNSYLTGSQLTSHCSDLPIIKALQGGVRVIELDLWPNHAKNNINILHGRTLTCPVDFALCLQSIKKYAFEASPYPVIITFEDHLTPNLQAKAAQMVAEIFEDMLYHPKSRNMEEFPSPESLKYRIIILTELKNKCLQSKDTDSQILMHLAEDEQLPEHIQDIPINLMLDRKNGDHGRKQSTEEEDSDDYDPRPCRTMPAVYMNLITIEVEKPKGSLREAFKNDPNRLKCLNLSELELQKVAVSNGIDVIRFARRNLLRIYPKGTRVTSSNYNPLTGWMLGVQMMAFNMQGSGRPLWLMQGFFKANGGCGFVKKPEYLKEDKLAYHSKADLHVKKFLKVVIYLGTGWKMDFGHSHFDKHSPPDFYARVGIAGVAEDCIVKKTKIIKDSWTPVWNEEFTFVLTVLETALLTIEVYDHDKSGKDDFGGQNCLPVHELRTGFRTIPLCDSEGEKLKSVKLLVRFEFVS